MRSRAQRLLLLLALLATVATAARTAHAVLDPSHAQFDVDESMRAGDYPFCRQPHEPLSARAEELCPHASVIPGCGGYEAACVRATATTPPPTPWWSRWLTIPPFIGTLAQGVVWLLVGALVIAVLVPIVRGLSHLRRKQALLPEARARTSLSPVPILADVATLTDEEQLLARARELAARGELAASMQLYLLASLRALDRRGAVRLGKDRTNGEYVRGCTDPGARPALRDIVREVDRVQFGGEAATAEGVGRAAQRAMVIVRTLPVAALLLSAFLTLGCSGLSISKERRVGDDPAGAELLRDVLSRQGVALRGLDSSLATMPLPGPGERVPAVLVDLARTSLDDDTREHLVAWVNAGGVLVLAGEPEVWPKELKATRKSTSGTHRVSARRLLARAVPKAPGDEQDDGDGVDDGSESAIFARDEQHGVLASSRGVELGCVSDRIAWFDDGTSYASVTARGHGFVLAMADDELLTNAALARPGNAAVLLAILSVTSRAEMRMADVEDGVSPPSTPIAALLRAGLGLALAHAVVFGLALFAAVGTRQARPTPAPPPRRRAFAEHVEAVGALYARARCAPHALAAYARFAEERLRTRMPRGSGDVAGFLASRTRVPTAVCQRLWARAMQAKAGAPPLGDELVVLRELGALYAAAMAPAAEGRGRYAAP